MIIIFYYQKKAPLHLTRSDYTNNKHPLLIDQEIFLID